MSSVETADPAAPIRSRALMLMSVALAFYFGFIALAIYRIVTDEPRGIRFRRARSAASASAPIGA